MSSVIRVPAGLAASTCDRATRVTRSLLGYGVLAGPVYVGVVLAQALIRPGFNLARHDASLLANGALGWIQIANFIATGAMVIAFALGVSRTTRDVRAGRWAARLLAGYGAGLVGAGIFVADPMNGFPVGAPEGMPATITTHGVLHLAFAGLGFLCFVGGCLLLARAFSQERRRAWALGSALAGVLFLVAFGGLASGSSSPAVVLGFWAALLVAWGWMAALAVHLYRLAGQSTVGTA